ncbi:histidine kinase : Chemotaxis protein methyltransferase CheR OS=Polaromonas naphthalenivorans (strain CJ2) PE=4 SV=1: PAS_9: PAS_4: PAS_9: PAS_4: PAS_9: PAS_8: PAS_4: PAS_8: PAS_3: PAS_3: HisKA: HATPase_c: Response_reg [Gemmataceae bacterium]|nr:histidine kinase : Chemotaxis protein methyltransferase CheR OS=Polaromonas naphthalenivorans (strain CJ2) PE=4 SV=1: PAS_9: PAS_4: PAS_9: PAS_4: PAS_9: PAS_8: PAS_4: PAS_8: PAS_3: PAS_3: HisKA: HATPase_c: Response_reg [Gemmataceae bacterium]VTT98138.1 histidine kinase : Chemotaxis protein methyltransferase CheR OS=Polaromonas naphthalenivorans (strain CJ2) PE=4 SV=1: PAS_9: PAS_4: PAS_9: PAS_4: PAS_9: PAS_8: PAS_4: PAS_8: PAS_3: PAS_3: HisKA: HATPase_c: Response_reg [Gemmataceae bacterium]
MGETGAADRAAWEGEMFRLLAENVVDYAVFIVDPHRHVLTWSKGAERLIGFTEGEIVGQKCDRFFTPEDVAAGVPQKELDEALAAGTGGDDRWYVRGDGRRFWSSGTVTPLRGPGGAVRGFAKIMRDRTALKQTQEARDDALAYADAIVATVREPLVVLDGALRVRTANRSFYQTFRVRPGDTEGRLLYDLGNGQWDIPALRTLLGEVLPRDAAFNDFEVAHDFPGIGPKVMLLNARKLWREGNHTELILLAVEDVTPLREAERAGREAEARFAEMVKNVRDHSIFLTDPDGVITSWNVAAERIIGYTEAEAVGSHFALIFTPEDVGAGVPGDELRQAREHGRAEDERWHRRKDGTLFWALGIVTPLHDPAGRLSGYSKILRDMTDWKRADEARRESEERFARFMEHLPGLAWVKDGRGRYVYANDAAVAAFGRPRAGLYGRSDEEVFPPDTARQFRENDLRAAAAGTGIRAVETLQHGDGVVRHSLVSKFQVPGPSGGPGLVGGVAIDITEEVRTRAVLEESEERFRATFEQAAVGIAHVATDGRWLRVNRKLCDIVGYAPDELLRLTFQDITHPEDVGADLAQLRRLLAGEIATYAMEKRYFRKDRRTIWINLTVALARTPAGEPKYLISVVEDITQRKAVEDALLESERKYRTLFENMAEEVHYWRVERDDRGRVVTWRLVDANPPALRTWGKSLDEIRGRTTDEIFGPGSTDHYRDVVRKITTEGVPHAFEDYFPALDRHFRFTSVPVGDHFITTGADITAIQRAHESLRQSEDRYRAVLESITDAFFAVGRDWTFTYVNRQAERVLDRTPGDLIGRSIWGEYPGLAGSQFERAYRRVMAERVTATVAAYYPDHDRWYEVHVYPAEGGISVYFRDVSERVRADEALRASEERFRTLFEAMDEGYCVIEMIFDPPGGDRAVDYRFLEVNPAFEAQAGMRGVVGRRMREFVADIEDHWLANYGRVALTGEPVRFANEYTGLNRWFEVYAFRVGGEGSRRVGVLFTDTTARVRADAALRESEERLRTLSDNLPLGAVYQVVAGPDGGRKFLYASAGIERLFGVSPAEAMADAGSLYGLVHEDDRPRVAAAEAVALRDLSPYECEFRSRTRSGGVRWVQARSAPRRLPDGAVVWEGIVADVTDRKRAEREAQVHRDRLDLVVNSVDVGLWYCDLPFDRLVWNAKVKEHFGLPPDHDVTIGTFYDRLHPDDRERTRGAIEASIRDRAGYDIEYRTVGLDGRERWVRAIGRTFYAPSGEPVSFDGITVDVTARVRQEHALKDADRRKDEFLATLAHELRNPLAPLRNGLQVMKLAAGNAAAVEKARAMMERQLGQMVHLIDDLLDVSRITRGKLRLRRERVELESVVRAAVETARPVIEASGHEFTAALPPGPVYLDADPVRLAQVLSNLLTNAAKYTGRGGRIQLTAVRVGGEVAVSVADTGIGIAPEHLPRLFEMFSQVSSALERSQGGLGIGLALVRGLVEMHGGTVGARSEGPGKGSEFVVRLPVADGPPARREPGAGREPASAGPGRRVLVADDNRDAADSLAMMLRLRGHEVHTAYDGRAAVEAAARLRPDVAVLDIGMPGLTGYDAARRIRAESWGRDMTLVAVTGWGQEEDKRRATEAGFDRHLTKPVDPAALEEFLAGPASDDAR